MPRSRKADTPKAKRQFDHVEQSMRDRGYSPKRAMMAANSVARKAYRKRRRSGRS